MSTIRRAAPAAILLLFVAAISATLTVRANAAAAERPPAPVTVVGQPLDVSIVGGSLSVAGAVEVSNLPTVQTVDGTVEVANLPAVQDVRIVADGSSAATTEVATFSASTTYGPSSTSFVVPEGRYLKDLVVLDAYGPDVLGNGDTSHCVFNLRTVPGDGTSTFATPDGGELMMSPLRLEVGFPGPLEVVVACGSNPDTGARGFFTTSSAP
jgi:hypothetical protein